MARSKMIRWFGTAALTASLVAGGVAITQAQTPTQQQEQPAQGQQQPAQGERPQGQRGPGGRGGPGGPGGRGGHGPREGVGKRLLVETTSDLTGLSVEEIAEQMRADETLTLASIASANGSSSAAVVDAAMVKVEERLSEAVANGRITQAEADEKLDQARERATALMDEPGLGGERGGPGHGDRDGARVLVNAVAEVTGLSHEEIRAGVEEGKSLAQITQEAGKTVDDVINHLRDKGEERLDTMLENAREALER